MNAFWLIEDYIFANDFLRFLKWPVKNNVKSNVFLKSEKNVKYVFSNTGHISVYIPPKSVYLKFFLCGCFVSLRWLVNIYTHPNQIPGYAPGCCSLKVWSTYRADYDRLRDVIAELWTLRQAEKLVAWMAHASRVSGSQESKTVKRSFRQDAHHCLHDWVTVTTKHFCEVLLFSELLKTLYLTT